MSRDFEESVWLDGLFEALAEDARALHAARAQVARVRVVSFHLL